MMYGNFVIKKQNNSQNGKKRFDVCQDKCDVNSYNKP